jgi:CheY-like chemotaxis protein
MSPSERVVLYIEDNPDNIRLVELLLARLDRVALRVATTGAEGITAALTLVPDLILLDNRLPDVTGADVLGRLRSEQLTSVIPVIVLTGDSERETATMLLSLGASAFLGKPFDINEFSQLIDQYLP